jgi:hypothetical protein
MSTEFLSLAVIGCGVIGSRHAQALGRLTQSAAIYLVDPSAANREQAASLCHQEIASKSNFRLVALDNVKDLPEQLDLAIVATGAADRRNVVDTLLARSHVTYLILEKFLFQSERDYEYIATQLTKAAVKTWVNCPRRVWPGYQFLRNLLAQDKGPIALSCATHSRFGLGTGAIHLLDALAYLCGRDDFQLRGDLLDSTFLPTRRGAIDMTGTLYGATSKGDFFRFTTQADGTLPPMVLIEAASTRAFVDEANGIMRISSFKDDWRWHERQFDMLLQSQLTHLIVGDLIQGGNCGLPGFAQSSRLHLSILRPLLAHYSNIVDRSATSCPIT